MDYLLFTLALAILLLAGAGITLFLARDRDMLGLAETGALSFLYGTAFISLTSFLFGFFLAGLQLRLMVSMIAASLGLLGLVRFRRARPVRLRRPRGREWLWIAVLCVQSLIVVWVSLRLALGFDGLFLWEAKARLIFQSGGVMPLDYLRANPAEIPYPDYPLLLPFTESWFYGFLGRAHQGWLKLVLPLFYFSSIGLLARNRLGKSYLPAVMLFFVPVLVIRSTTGEPDFPLAVFYLAASLFLLDYLRTGNERLLFLAGTLAALLPWVKREGWILFTLLMIAGAAKLVKKREIRNLLVLAAPGVLWIGFWRLFLSISGAQTHQDYLPVTFTTLAANIDRLPVIAAEASKEFFRWRTWNMLWLIPLRGLLTLRQSWIWMFLVVAPVVLYAGIYVFTWWEPFTKHMDASYSRILTHVSLVALLGLNSSPPTAPLFTLRGEDRPLPDASAS